MRNYFVESKEHNPWKNLAIEKHLAEGIRSGDFLLYLWQNDNTVVIGRNQNALQECRAKLLEEEGGYLARRTTGGGAVYQDLGNLCFTFMASPERYDLNRQMKVVQKACLAFGIETEFSGRNDIITKDGYKFSGNAFSMTNACKIQHGTLMVDVDKEKMARYLTPSEEKMKAKGVKSVKSRVCNLKQLNSELTIDLMKEALQQAFVEEYGVYEELSLTALQKDALEQTYEMYASWDWKYGKTPECETIYKNKYPWGEVEIHLKLKNLCVQECKVYTDALDPDLPKKLEQALLQKPYDVNFSSIIENCMEEKTQK